MKWKWKRPAAFLLAAAMIFTMPGVPASEVEAGVSAVHTGCASITRNIQRTADIRKEPKGQTVNMSILRIATPL